jgi:DNA invertase Pin-like site-specific DNA recombinase
MKHQAIVLNRISSKDQLAGHSLEAQLKNAKDKARELDVEIVQVWSGVLSSNKGKNLGRKDLEEMLALCKKNKRIKYLLVDMVNRLMREMKVMVYYMVRFEELGVKIVFCDPSQQHLNSDDQMAQLMVVIEGFKAEADNKSRGETSVSRMKSRVELGYYPTHPHQGYMKSDKPGWHIPDPVRFKPLQDACKHIIYDGWSVNQAVKWLNDSGYRTRAGRKMTLDHFIDLFMDRYYCGFVSIKSDGWPKDVRGVHEPMLSVREHTTLVAVMTKRNPRLRLQHNPDFPLSNILRHEECVGQGGFEKFTGVNFNRGKRPNGSQRPIKQVYDCRDCRKRVPRDTVHANLTTHLASLQLVPDKDKFRQALIKVWKMQRGSVSERLRVLEIKKQTIEQKMLELTEAYASSTASETIKTNLEKLIAVQEAELKATETDIVTTQNVDLESEDFVDFAMQYVAALPENWWSLSHENRVRGEQILFNGKIYANNSAIVRTPELSSIYRLGVNKKDLGKVSLSNMVELAGTAPASVGLS